MNLILPSDQALFSRSRVVARLRLRVPLAVFAATLGLLAPVAATAQQADGERLFQQRCGGCHSTEAGQNRTGPHLSDVIGRAAGSIEGAPYSDAMRDSGIVWDDQTLDTFLAAPRETVSGTRMTVGVSDAAERAAITAYLKNQ